MKIWKKKRKIVMLKRLQEYKLNRKSKNTRAANKMTMKKRERKKMKK